MTFASPVSHCLPFVRCTLSGSSTVPPGAARSGLHYPGAAPPAPSPSSPFPVRVLLLSPSLGLGPSPHCKFPVLDLSGALGTGSLCCSLWTKIGTRRWSRCVLACVCWADGPWGQPRIACLPGERHRSSRASCVFLYPLRKELWASSPQEPHQPFLKGGSSLWARRLPVLDLVRSSPPREGPRQRPTLSGWGSGGPA